jgi:oligoendopeptidase F
MLKAGGSKHHKDLLAPFGLDASDPKPSGTRACR